ncbi:hypothetical protein AB0J40_29000 [Amycolatopsis sp. NPDC049691]|uniref:hypothetical protein n=1 Tax=Amycolatopsis sp. NPDC049691 TaxID=3155155 RepID=UPI00341D4B6A
MSDEVVEGAVAVAGGDEQATGRLGDRLDRPGQAVLEGLGLQPGATGPRLEVVLVEPAQSPLGDRAEQAGPLAVDGRGDDGGSARMPSQSPAVMPVGQQLRACGEHLPDAELGGLFDRFAQPRVGGELARPGKLRFGPVPG